MDSQFAETPLLGDEQCGEGSNNGTTPRTSLNADVTARPSMRTLQGSISSTRSTGQKRKTRNRASGIVPPSSSTNFTSPTPSKVLLEKLHYLEEQWSSQKSVSSAYSRRSSSEADVSSPSRQPTTATTADQSTRSEAEYGNNRPLISITANSKDVTKNNAKEGTTDQEQSETPLARGSHKNSPQRSLRLFVDTTPNEQKDISHQDHILDEMSDHVSVGESTISTLSSGGSSVFDRLPLRNDNQNRISRSSASSTGGGHSLGSQRNKNKHTDNNATTPQSAYTPKMSSVSRRRDRVRAFQAGSRNQPSQATIKSKSTTAYADGDSITSSKSKQKEDYSSFHRLYRNEKRSEKLWKATPPPAPTSIASPNGNHARKEPMSKNDKNRSDFSLFHRLYRNEKRSEKLWETTPSPSKETPMDRNSGSGGKDNSDLGSFHRLHRNEKRTERLWEASKLKDSTIPGITTQRSSSTTTTTGSSTYHSPRAKHAKISSLSSDDGANLDEDIDGLTTPQAARSGTCGGNQKTPMEMLQEEMNATQSFDADSLSLLSSHHSKDFSEHDEDLRGDHDNDNGDQSPPRQTANSNKIEDEETLSPLSQLKELSALVESTTKPFLDCESESPPTASTESEVSSSQLDCTSTKVEELHESCSRSGFFSLDNATGGLVMAYRAPAGKHFFAEKLEQLAAPAGRRRRRLQNTAVRGELTAEDETWMILSPTRLRDSSTVTIQNAWRCHRAQLSTVSALLRSSDVDCSFQPKLLCGTSQLRVHRYQIIAMSQAIGSADCWWILDGLQVDNNAVSVVWKKELTWRETDSIKAVTVCVKCEARRAPLITDSWGRRKIAILLVKAALSNSLNEEQRRMRRCAAVVIQMWWLRMACLLSQPSILSEPRAASRSEEVRVQPKQLTATKLDTADMKSGNLECGGDDLGESTQKSNKVTNREGSTGQEAAGSTERREERITHLNDSTAALRIQFWFRMMAIRIASRRSHSHSVEPLPSADDSSDDHSAATTIQSWLRMTVVRSAFRSSHDFNQFDFPYDSSPGSATLFSGPSDALLLAAQGYGDNSQNRLVVPHATSWNDPFKTLSLGEAMVSDLAIKDVIRAYVSSLRWHRRNRKAALIQSVFRGYQVRRLFRVKRAAAILIQDEVRRHLNFSVASKIQRMWRRKNAMKLYNDQKHSTLVIQCFWRRYLARSQLLEVVRAVTILQATSRRITANKSFHSLRNAVIKLQRTWRRSRAKDFYNLQTFCAITIQSNWRQASAQWNRRNKMFAALVVQSAARSFIARSQFMISRGSVRTVQKTWRMRRAQKQFWAKKVSTVIIQAVWRKKLALWRFQDTLFAISNIQRLVRGAYARKRFVSLVTAATTVQKEWRRKYAEDQLMLSLGAIKILQMTYRRHKLDRQFRLETLAAGRIQSSFKAYKHRTTFQLTRSSTISLQRVYRGFNCRTTLRRRAEAANVIQSQWNEYCRRRIEAEAALRANERIAAIVLQRSWRGSHARAVFAAQIRRAVCIQSQWRGSNARITFTFERASLIMIQSLARGVIVREKQRLLQAKVVTAQRTWRWGMARRRMNKERSAIRIQRRWRMHKMRSKYLSMRSAAIVVQSCLRRHNAVVEFSCIMMHRNASASLIQTKWRSFIYRRRYLDSTNHVCTLQKICRGYLCRKLLQEEQETLHYDAAVLLQCAIRSMWARRNIKFKYCVVVVQRSWRGAIARYRFSRARVSAIMLQSLARRGLALTTAQREALRIQAIVGVQACWRGGLSRHRYQQARVAATRIQSSVRRNRAMLHMAVAVSAAESIQNVWRGSVARDSYVFTRSCAIMVQTHVRGFIIRNQYLVSTSSVLTIQRIWRGTSIRRRYFLMLEERTISTMLQERKVELIQRSWRRHRVRVTYLSSRSSAILIQSYVRRCQAAQIVEQLTTARESVRAMEDKAAIVFQNLWRAHRARKEYFVSRSSARTIQRAWNARQQHRRHRAATLLQRQWRSSIARAMLADAIGSAIIIQALARGTIARWALRYTLLDPEKRQLVDEAARKIQVAFFMWKVELKLWEMRSSVILLQRSVRGQLGRSAARFALFHMNSSVQSSVLSSFARIVAASNPEVVSTTTAWNRAVTQARVFGCIIIQSSVRRMIARDYVRRSFGMSFGMTYLPAHVQSQRKSAATIIQRAFRAMLKIRLAAICIQARWRESASRRNYSRQRWAAVAIQRVFRDSLERRLRKLRRAARKRRRQAALLQASSIKIQSAWRRCLCYSSFNRMKTSAILIQGSTRSWICRRFQAKSAAAISIQCVARRMLARTAFKEVVAAHGQRLEEASHSILTRLQRISEETVGRLLGQDRNILTVDASPCLHRLAHRVSKVESEALDSADLVPQDLLDEGLVGDGGLTPEQVLGMPFLRAMPLFLAAAESNVKVELQNFSPHRAKAFLERSSPLSSSVESAILPANKASTPRRCNKSTSEDVGIHFVHEDEVASSKQPNADTDDGSNEGPDSQGENVENISDLVAQARSLLSAARHQFHSNPKPSNVPPVTPKAEIPLQLLQPTLAQSTATVTTRNQTLEPSHLGDQEAGASGDGESPKLDEQLFGEDDEVISPIKTNKSVESWDWTDAW